MNRIQLLFTLCLHHLYVRTVWEIVGQVLSEEVDVLKITENVQTTVAYQTNAVKQKPYKLNL